MNGLQQSHSFCSNFGHENRLRLCSAACVNHQNLAILSPCTSNQAAQSSNKWNINNLHMHPHLQNSVEQRHVFDPCRDKESQQKLSETNDWVNGDETNIKLPCSSNLPIYQSLRSIQNESSRCRLNNGQLSPTNVSSNECLQQKGGPNDCVYNGSCSTGACFNTCHKSGLCCGHEIHREMYSERLKADTSNSKSNGKKITCLSKCRHFRRYILFSLFICNILTVASNALIFFTFSNSKDKDAFEQSRVCIDCASLKKSIGYGVDMQKDLGFELSNDGQCCLRSTDQLLPLVSDLYRLGQHSMSQGVLDLAGATPVVQYQASGAPCQENSLQIEWKLEDENPVQRMFQRLDSDSAGIYIPSSGVYYVFAYITHSITDTSASHINFTLVVKKGQDTDARVDKFDDFDHTCDIIGSYTDCKAYNKGSLHRLQAGDQLFLKINTERCSAFRLNHRKTRLGIFHVS